VSVAAAGYGDLNHRISLVIGDPSASMLVK
jgi:hypothetical protein